jgi:hypothetical protein
MGGPRAMNMDGRHTMGMVDGQHTIGGIPWAPWMGGIPLAADHGPTVAIANSGIYCEVGTRISGI